MKMALVLCISTVSKDKARRGPPMMFTCIAKWTFYKNKDVSCYIYSNERCDIKNRG